MHASKLRLDASEGAMASKMLLQGSEKIRFFKGPHIGGKTIEVQNSWKNVPFGEKITRFGCGGARLRGKEGPGASETQAERSCKSESGPSLAALWPRRVQPSHAFHSTGVKISNMMWLSDITYDGPDGSHTAQPKKNNSDVEWGDMCAGVAVDHHCLFWGGVVGSLSNGPVKLHQRVVRKFLRFRPQKPMLQALKNPESEKAEKFAENLPFVQNQTRRDAGRVSTASGPGRLSEAAQSPTEPNKSGKISLRFPSKTQNPDKA
ncbi:hypothetical protein C8R45DRAFT_933265 [Mycena sanguinolenta]|nr:hypothetical protein C8R45DRAFT_933265 [Mycena sanguinolenta]